MRRKVLVVAILIIAILLQSFMPFTMVYAETETESGTGTEVNDSENEADDSEAEKDETDETEPETDTETDGSVAEREDGSVEITLNSNLYKAVKEQLKEQNITVEYRDANRVIVISQEELAKVTNLNLSNKGINDLKGLEAFKNVTELNLHANELTSESNLSSLNGLKLESLDLSSNKLDSVSSISNRNNIQKFDITNQKYTGREIITVDASEDAKERLETVEVDLPDILLEDGGKFDPKWIQRTITKADGKSPEVDYEGLNLGASKLKIKVGSIKGTEYTVKKGLLKVEFKVEDSSSKLANTHMIFYYAIVDQDETGIAFDDENLYKAVKAQLTQDQTINKELKETTKDDGKRNLYQRTYDEALIMVIKTDDVINNIPSLILNDKKIKDLRGIEEFVGLKSDLNISYNYINSLKRIIELSENKTKKEQELRDKYSKILDELKKAVDDYDKQQEIINDENADDKAKETAKKKAQGDITLINKYMTKLYSIYKYEYKLVSLLPAEVNYLSYNDLLRLDQETSEKYVSDIISRISNLEKNDALTVFENDAIIKLLEQWATKNELAFDKIIKVDDTDGDSDENEEKEIEYPISNFFENVVSLDATLSLDGRKEFIYIFKAIDSLSQIESYTVLKRIGESKDSDYANEALATIKETLKDLELDTHFYDLIKNETNVTDEKCFDESCKEDTQKEGYIFDNTSEGNNKLIDVKIGLNKKYYSGKIEDTKSKEAEKDKANVTIAECKLKLAHKLNLVTSEDITTYITLPKIKKLNLADNKVGTLKGIEVLKELRELNAWKNMINDITTDMNWGAFTKLKALNLGYNQISDIEVLEVLTTLENLDLSYNLLAGSFSFNLLNMKNLSSANFSHNQYSDIDYVNDQFILKALGYDENGDEVADQITVPEYLKKSGINLNFQYQNLETYATVVRTGEEFIDIDLPPIFQQLEEMDSDRTSFGLTSQDGLKVPQANGDYKGVVTVEGRSGYEEIEKKYTTSGIGYGTTCTIYYSVVDAAPLPGNPANPDNPTNPDDPTKPDQDQPSEQIEYGYSVEEGYVIVYKPETKLTEFVQKVVDPEKYGVTITENNSTENIASGAVVSITDKTGAEVYGMLETVVKGDINGDGEIDALDSGVIRKVVNDTEALVGVYESAADVNHDGDIDSQDSLLILQYRADRIGSFEK